MAMIHATKPSILSVAIPTQDLRVIAPTILELHSLARVLGRSVEFFLVKHQTFPEEEIIF